MISVCITTYNGEKYIREQIESILTNITSSDEVIISDDGSTDKTLEILEKYCLKNKNIKILNGPKLGVIKNFENAIKNASGDIIFLSDQDDVWMENKVSSVIDTFEKNNCDMVVHDAVVIDKNENIHIPSFYMLRNSKSGLCKNLYKNSYIGCCMAFRREVFDLSYPFASNLPMHDWWLGLVADLKFKSVFIDDKLIKYRRHGNNVSNMHRFPVSVMIKNRVILLKELLKVWLK